MDDIKLGWPAGFIDGEGTICISTDKKEHRLHPQLMLTNTSLPALVKAQGIMLELGVENPRLHFHQIHQSRLSYRTNLECHRVYVGTAVGLKTVLRAVLPELTAKRKQAALMLEFLEKRMGRSARVRFTARDFEIAEAIANVNRPKVRALETTREAPQTIQSVAMI